MKKINKKKKIQIFFKSQKHHFFLFHLRFRCPYSFSDSEGYLKNFAIEEENEIMNFFNEYGLVIIRDVIDSNQIERTINEIWESPTNLGQNKFFF